VRGKAEIANAPIIPHVAVSGIVLYSPPTSVHFLLPVINITLPADINSKPL